jgi:hypothetical protein
MEAMKVFLLSFLITMSAFAERSLFPLQCGRYKLFASAEISTVDHLLFRIKTVLASSSLSKTKLDLTWASPKKFAFPPTTWISGTIFVNKISGPATMDGFFETQPQVLQNKEKAYQESIELVEAKPCTH